MFVNPRQQLNQVELIEEIVLEPEDQLVVRLMPCDDVTPSAHVIHRIPPTRFGPASVGRVVLTAHVDQLGVRQSARNGAVMQRVGPDGVRPGHARLCQRHRDRRAVRDVQISPRGIRARGWTSSPRRISHGPPALSCRFTCSDPTQSGSRGIERSDRVESYDGPARNSAMRASICWNCRQPAVGGVGGHPVAFQP